MRSRSSDSSTRVVAESGPAASTASPLVERGRQPAAGSRQINSKNKGRRGMAEAAGMLEVGGIAPESVARNGFRASRRSQRSKIPRRTKLNQEGGAA